MSDQLLPADKPKARRGRPRVLIDYARVDAMCKALGRSTDIAAALGISDDTLQDAIWRDHKMTFTEYRQQHAASTFHLLRTTQIKEALGYEYEEEEVERDDKGRVKKRVTRKVRREPSASMLIWLGKNVLGQTDKHNVQHDIPGFMILGDTPEGIDGADLVD